MADRCVSCDKPRGLSPEFRSRSLLRRLIVRRDCGQTHPRQNSTTAAFPSMRRPSGAGNVSSNTVSSVKNAANPSASCRLKASLKLSTVLRVDCSCECTFCPDLMGTSLGEHRLPNRNTEQVTTKMWRPMRCRSR